MKLCASAAAIAARSRSKASSAMAAALAALAALAAALAALAASLEEAAMLPRLGAEPNDELRRAKAAATSLSMLTLRLHHGSAPFAQFALAVSSAQAALLLLLLLLLLPLLQTFFFKYVCIVICFFLFRAGCAMPAYQRIMISNLGRSLPRTSMNSSSSASV